MALRPLIVRAAKIGLPVAALAVAAAIWFGSSLNFDDRIAFDGVDFSALDEGLKLTNPRFTGATARGEPFEVTAEWALPDGPEPETIELSKPAGEINLSDGRFVELSALSGVLEPRRNVLTLTGSVRLESSDGRSLRAARARVDARARTLSADGPVRAEGPMGVIEAGALRVERDGAGRPGDYIWFENGVKLRIETPNMAREPG